MLTYRWNAEDGEHELGLVRVAGTDGTPFLFGGSPKRRSVEVKDFYIGATPVTQALWRHLMGSNPSRRLESRAPVENVSWNEVTGPDGFLARINASPARVALDLSRTMAFRLPTEAEWEYAARGGPKWEDDFQFAGNNDPDKVAWYGPRWSKRHKVLVGMFGWGLGWRLANKLNVPKPTRTHQVATKQPNQLGVYDMSGNVFEWCQDPCVEMDDVPTDGTAAPGPSDERRLRGGSHENWDLHCRVWWRYGLTPEGRGSSIGLRLVLAPE